MNLKNLLVGACVASVALFSMATVQVSGATLDDPEFDSALAWAYENGLTMYNTVDSFMPFSNLTREQFAKFAASFAVTNVCLETDVGAACDFSDIPADPTLGDYVTLACKLGLVKGSQGKYMPTANVSKAEVLTVMSRAMAAAADEDAPSEDVTPRWSYHYQAMYAAGITKEVDVNALDRPVTRYEVLLMLFRAKNDDASCSDVDISDLLDDLFGDDVTDGDDVDDTVAPVSDGTVKAMLSPSTPNGASLPWGVTAKVATFDFTATEEDVVLHSIDIQRTGLGNDDIIRKMTLFANGEVVTKSKTENSDDVFSFVLNPVVTVKKGETVTIEAVATVGSSATYQSQEFAVSLIGFDTNGKENTTNLPSLANTFRVAAVEGSTVTLQGDGSVSNPNLGAKGVDVMKFKLKGDSNNDVEITQITVVDQKKNADDDLANITLKHKGVAVATVAKANGKYVTFMLTTPIKIESGKTEKFVVVADVVAWAGDQIAFDIDQEIYILGNDLKYGYGIAVAGTNAFSEQTLTIIAGEVTLSENALPVDKVRADRDDVVLASFDLVVKEGQLLSLEDIKFTLAGSTGGMAALFEDVELQVIIAGSTRTYDLTYLSNTYYDTDLGISIPDGATMKVNLIGDMAAPTVVTPFVGQSFYFTLSTSDGFEIIELDDDTVVTDITPSSITFDTVDVVNPTVTVSRLFLGNVDVVRGTAKVDAYKFQVKTDNVSSVLVNEFTFSGSVTLACTGASAGSLTKNTVTQFQLRQATTATTGGYTLIKSESASKLSAGSLTFTNLNIEIAKSATQDFLLTVDVAGTDALDECKFVVAMASSNIEDDDGYTLSATGPWSAVGRTITIQGAGTLSTVVDVTDSSVNRAKYVVGGTISDYVASFDITAINEDMDVTDLTLLVSGSTNFDSSVAEVVLYNEAGTEITRKGVTSATSVAFTDLPSEKLLAKQGTTTLYVKVITNGIWLNQGTDTAMGDVQLALRIDEAKGKSSGTKVWPLSATAYAYAFDVLPVHLSAVEFIESTTPTGLAGGGGSVDLGSIKLTANTWNNLANDGTALKLKLTALAPQYSGPVASWFTVERTDISTNNLCTATLTGGRIVIDFTSCDTASLINKAGSATFKFKATYGVVAETSSATLEFTNVNDGASVGYRATDVSVGGAVTDPRLSKSSYSKSVKNF